MESPIQDQSNNFTQTTSPVDPNSIESVASGKSPIFDKYQKLINTKSSTNIDEYNISNFGGKNEYGNIDPRYKPKYVFNFILSNFKKNVEIKETPLKNLKLIDAINLDVSASYNSNDPKIISKLNILNTRKIHSIVFYIPNSMNDSPPPPSYMQIIIGERLFKINYPEYIFGIVLAKDINKLIILPKSSFEKESTDLQSHFLQMGSFTKDNITFLTSEHKPILSSPNLLTIQKKLQIAFVSLDYKLIPNSKNKNYSPFALSNKFNSPSPNDNCKNLNSLFKDAFESGSPLLLFTLQIQKQKM